MLCCHFTKERGLDEDKSCYIVYLNGDRENGDEVSESYKTVKKMILDALNENKIRKQINIE